MNRTYTLNFELNTLECILDCDIRYSCSSTLDALNKGEKLEKEIKQLVFLGVQT